MKVLFQEPPPEQAVGGLDLAIRTLEAHLRNAGVKVINERAHESVDVVHFHGIWQPSHSALAKELRAENTPYLVSPHGMLEPWALQHKRWKKIPYFRWKEKPYLANASAVLATAQTEARSIQELLPGVPITTIPLGLPAEKKPEYLQARAFLEWENEEKVLLYLSRIHRKKGLDLLIKALSNLDTDIPHRLVIVGKGDEAYRREILKFIKSARKTLPPIEWVGEMWNEEKWYYLQGADLFCLPTHSENFGLAVLEAYQVGTPVLTTTGTPWKDMLPPEGGIIVKPNERSIQAGLQDFLNTYAKWSESERQQLSQWAFENFHWNELTNRYIALYKSLAGS